MNLTNLWGRAIKHSLFNRSVDGAPGAMRRAVRPFGQPHSAPPQPCPVRRGARGSFRPQQVRALGRHGRAVALAALAVLALAVPVQAQTVLVQQCRCSTLIDGTDLLGNDAAQSFTTGTHATGYSLTSIELRLSSTVQAFYHSYGAAPTACPQTERRWQR